jgi:uncharacterized membrane protein
MRWWKNLSRSAFLAAMLLGSVLITLASLVYFEPGTVAPFIIEKLPVRFERMWRLALQVHVPSALVSFPACILLMTKVVQRRRNLHRWLGRVTGAVVGFLLVPSGLVLALEAKGGVWVSVGFVLSGLIVWVALVRGVIDARRGRMLSHARSMRHLFAQMTVAVTSRTLLVLLDLGGMNPDLAYVLSLWVPVLGSALVAEGISGGLPRISLSSPQTALRSPS